MILQLDENNIVVNRLDGCTLERALSLGLRVVEGAGFVGGQWDAEKKSCEEVKQPKASPKFWPNPQQFMAELSFAEHAAIVSAAKTDPIIEVLLHRLDGALQGIHADNSDLEQGLQYLVAKNLLTAERVNAILN